MSFAPAAKEVEGTPYGDAVVGRGIRIQHVVETRAISGAWSAKDISGAQWTYQLRIWTSDDDAAVIDDDTVTKGAGSASGELDHFYSVGTTVRDTLRWELVEVDNNNADANAISGFREGILRWWRQPIIDAPVA